MNSEEILLQAINRGKHDDRRLPQHPEPHAVRDENGNKQIIFVDVIDPATSSIDLTILRLAVNGNISPEKLVEIYPEKDMLRRHLVVTMENLEKSKQRELANGINDLLILRMCAIPGWD